MIVTRGWQWRVGLVLFKWLLALIGSTAFIRFVVIYLTRPDLKGS